MTDIEQKALALANEVSQIKRSDLCDCSRDQFREALCRAIEQHEAFRQEVSDAAEHLCKFYGVPIVRQQLERFIITKPDPLVEVMNEMGFGWSKTASEEFRAAMKARGYEWRKITWGEG